MPHAAVVAAAVTAAVGTAIAFEIGVFRPWREENFPEGFANGMRTEWQEFKQDFRRGWGDWGETGRRLDSLGRHRLGDGSDDDGDSRSERGDNATDDFDGSDRRDFEMQERDSKMASNVQRSDAALRQRRLQTLSGSHALNDDNVLNDVHSSGRLIEIHDNSTPLWDIAQEGEDAASMHSSNHQIGLASPTLSYATMRSRSNTTHTDTDEEWWQSRGEFRAPESQHDFEEIPPPRLRAPLALDDDASSWTQLDVTPSQTPSRSLSPSSH